MIEAMKCHKFPIFFSVTYLWFVSQPDNPSVVPLLSTSTPIDCSKTRILLLEVVLALDHLNIDARSLEDLPHVLFDPIEPIYKSCN